MKKSILFLFSIILLTTSCTQRGCQKFNKTHQYSDRVYQITLFSGGDTVFTDSFTGIVNGESGTDGFFYFKGDTLIEVSGDYVLRSLDK